MQVVDIGLKIYVDKDLTEEDMKNMIYHLQRKIKGLEHNENTPMITGAFIDSINNKPHR